MKIEIMDTTLRDGEQTSGVSYTDTEKLNIAKVLLDEVQVDRIEVASAKVSEGEFNAAKTITEWAKEAGQLEKVEILGFVDNESSLNWIKKAGGKVVNLLCKGSENHVRHQLRKTPEEHVNGIKQVLRYAKEKDIKVNLYLEDWSNGMRNSKDYVYQFIDSLKDENVERFMLPDTLGILNPDEVYEYLKDIRERYPSIHFDFHAHNDYDLGAGNIFSAVNAGSDGLHATVNGLGERAGNVTLSSMIGIIHDQITEAETNINESKLHLVSTLVETFSGIRIPANKPIVGENVFTQTSGIHADGDQKNNLYHNELIPERFGRQRKYALGKMSGKASIKKNLEELGIDLDEDTMKKLTQKVIELGDKKQYVTKEDLPYIISDFLKSSKIEQKIQVKNFNLSVAEGLSSMATLRLSIHDEDYEETASGDGQYDAFMKALARIYDKLDKTRPKLKDYLVTIPPGGQTDALVETIITWEHNGKEYQTRGLDSDQAVAAIKATVKMLNLMENNTL